MYMMPSPTFPPFCRRRVNGSPRVQDMTRILQNFLQRAAALDVCRRDLHISGLRQYWMFDSLVWNVGDDIQKSYFPQTGLGKLKNVFYINFFSPRGVCAGSLEFSRLSRHTFECFECGVGVQRPLLCDAKISLNMSKKELVWME